MVEYRRGSHNTSLKEMCVFKLPFRSSYSKYPLPISFYLPLDISMSLSTWKVGVKRSCPRMKYEIFFSLTKLFFVFLN